MDGDARGGAALSIYGVTKKPIKYIGVGEKPDALEEFHPERMAGRILQMGDIVSLVEKAQAAFDEDEAKRLEKKVRKEGMDLERLPHRDAADRRSSGPLEGMLKMLPGVNTKMLKQAKLDPEADEARRGDRALDDAGGAEEPGDHQRLAPGAHREGRPAGRSAK